VGRSVQDGITGFGLTVETALHPFDIQYLRALQPLIKAEEAA
jgi:hypothetical protein